MGLNSILSKKAGVIGAGAFGTAIANLLAHNIDVVLYVRNKETAASITTHRQSAGQDLAANITVTTDLAFLTKQCDVIFPIIPSQGCKALLSQLAPLLSDKHILIHGMKGFHVVSQQVPHPTIPGLYALPPLSRDQIKTMRELITSQTGLTQIGCIAGPNLASELAQGQLAAVVIASPSKLVMEVGKKLLKGDNFQVYTNNDILGVELCGALKNIIAIGAGCLSGLGYGENAKAFLISRGLVEMVHIGKAMGATVKPFLGLAGIGDLIATCASKQSRNYTVGYRLAQGERLDQILSNPAITAEGVYTVQVIRSLIGYYKMRAPITETMYKILFEGLAVQEAIAYLMKYPLDVDVDFM